MVRVYQLAKQLNITSKRVLEVAEILGINVKAHQSSLSEEDVSKIIKYLKKNRRIGIVFNKAVLTLIDFIKNALKKRNFANGLFLGLTAFTIFGFSISNANDSVAEVEIIDTVEQIDVLTTTPTELIDQEGSSPPLFTDSDDATTTTTFPVTTTTTTVPVTTTTTTVPVTTTTTVPVTTTTTVPVTTTTTTVPVTCDDESFTPYTLYKTTGEANTVMSCRNEQEALVSGYIFLVNPMPPPTSPSPTQIVPVSTNYTFTYDNGSLGVSNPFFNFFSGGVQIEIDSQKNIYVGGFYISETTLGGQTYNPEVDGSILVFKLNNLGELEWVKTYGGTDNGSDPNFAIGYNYLSDMTVDSSDNVILTGRFIGTDDFGTGTPKTASTLFNSFVLKLGSNGDAQWVHTNYVSSTSTTQYTSYLDDSPTAVDTDSNGNIYVTGRFDGHYGQDSYLNIGSYAIDLTQITYGEYFIKINPSGVVQWVYITEDVAPARGQKVFVDTQDNIYLAGKCNVSPSQSSGTVTLEKVGGSDIFSMDCSGISSIKFSWVYVAKLDSSGEYIWHWMSKSWNSVVTLSVAGDTGVYVAYNTYIWEGEGFYNQQEICGTTLQPTTGGQNESHLMLVKLNSAGTCQWFYREEPRDNGAVSMVMDSNNNLYLQHKPSVTIGRTLERFSPQGVQTSYTGAGSIYDFVIDAEDNIYTLSNYVKADAATGQWWPGVSKRTLSDLVIN